MREDSLGHVLELFEVDAELIESQPIDCDAISGVVRNPRYSLALQRNGR